MAEKSGLWTTGVAGDGLTKYTEADWSEMMAVLAASAAKEGVGVGYRNSLAGSVTGANTVQIASGGGVVDGKVHWSDSALNVNIPSAVGAGNTRIDRIVLRCVWANRQVRITRIAGIDAAAPAAPAITQNSGVTYDVLLYQARVTTAGVVTLTDERAFAAVGTNAIANAAVTLAKLIDGILSADAAGRAKMADAFITLAKLADGLLTADAAGRAKMANGFVNAALLAADSVDDTKVGNKVPALISRQGGDPVSWYTGGTNNYNPGNVRMIVGAFDQTIPAGQTKIGAIQYDFGTAFSARPLVLPSVLIAPFDDPVVPECIIAQPGYFQAFIARNNPADTAREVTARIAWLAIGPE